MKRHVLRVIRGGSYYYDSGVLGTAIRGWSAPEGRFRTDGFRIVVVRRKKP